MKKEEILQRMNFNSLCDLVSLIEYEKDITELTAQIIAEDGKKVKVSKDETSIEITIDGSPKLYVSSVPTAYNPYEKRDVVIVYQFDDNNSIEFAGTANFDLNGIDKEALADNLKISYNSYGNTTLFNWFLIPNGIQIDDEGIRYHNMLLSFDGKEIKKINDEAIPSKKDLTSFSYEEEAAKVDSFLNSQESNLNGITRKYIEDAMELLRVKGDYLSRSVRDYEKVTDRVSALVDTREKFIGHLEEIDFRTNYLGFVREWVADFSKRRKQSKSEEQGKAYSKKMKNEPQE